MDQRWALCLPTVRSAGQVRGSSATSAFFLLTLSRFFISLSARRHSSCWQWEMCCSPQENLLQHGKYELDYHRTWRSVNQSLSVSEEASCHPCWWQGCYHLITAPAVILKRKPLQAYSVRAPSYWFLLSFPCEPLSDKTHLQQFLTPDGAQGGAAHITMQAQWIRLRNRMTGALRKVMSYMGSSFEVRLCWGYFGCLFLFVNSSST